MTKQFWSLTVLRPAMQLNMRDSGVSWGCDGRILVLIVTLEIKKKKSVIIQCFRSLVRHEKIIFPIPRSFSIFITVKYLNKIIK